MLSVEHEMIIFYIKNHLSKGANVQLKIKAKKKL